MQLHTRFLMVALLFSAAPTILAEKCSTIRSKDIGFAQSPNPLNNLACLGLETTSGLNTTLFYGSAVSPTLAVNPVNENFMVGNWQQDRFSSGGGALDIAIATSSNRGSSWSATTFPYYTCNKGITARSTNQWAAYSPDGKKVYLGAVNLNVKTDPNSLNQRFVTVSTSSDNGKTWSPPHTIFATSWTTQNPVGAAVFNNLVAVDPKLPNNAYDLFLVSPDAFLPASSVWFSRTTDGGNSWEVSRPLYNPANDTNLINNLSNGDPQAAAVSQFGLIRVPNGDLIGIVARLYATPGSSTADFINDAWPYQHSINDFAVVRSTDDGLTWNPIATQIVFPSGQNTISLNPIYSCGYTISGGAITDGLGVNMRTPEAFGIGSVAVNPVSGKIYIAWGDSRFNTPGNQLNQIALTTSSDGGLTWTEPVRISRTPLNAPNPQAFTPTIAVNEKGQVGLLYHDFRNSPVAVPCCDPSCNLPTQTPTDTWFALYKEVALGTGSLPQAGLDFVEERRLSCQSYVIENGPATVALNPQGAGGEGIMVNADQEGLVAGKSCFYALYDQTHNGPFNPPQTVINSPALGRLNIDNNRRVTPFFSRINTCRK